MDWTVHKVATGYLRVSGCGLFWQGACHLSLSVPYQMAGHRWPPPLWNVPRVAESRQGPFEKYKFTSVSGGQGGMARACCPWQAGLSGVGPPVPSKRLFKYHIRQ